ncbi:hypothetical protein Tco_1401122 [Tanacetum coccineum]
MKEPFGNWLEVIELGMEVITDEVAKATRLDANPSVLLVLPVPFAEGNRLCFLMEPGGLASWENNDVMASSMYVHTTACAFAEES